MLSAQIPSAVLGGLLYLGAGVGLFITTFIKHSNVELKLTKKDLPFVIAMVLLDIFAIIFLMFGISKTIAANVSLLSNFELVATSIVACIFFKEFLSKRMWLVVLLITIACSILTFEGRESFVFNTGSIFVLLSALCWGIENNCTRMLSVKDTRQITIIKGVFSGLGCLLVSQIVGSYIPEIKYVVSALLLGFFSYGISVCFYIYAQRFLGAVKTASYYSTTPFFGVIFCFLLLGDKPHFQFYIALIIMIIASVLNLRCSNNIK